MCVRERNILRRGIGMDIGNRQFDTAHHTYIMGILNVTPDSFSDGGVYTDTDAALFRVEQMLKEGADIIDIGGESTRPGHTQISCEEEIARTAPVIERIRREFDPVISIDTYKSQVAQAAIEAGSDMLNDIWGFRYDLRMAELAAKYGKPCCLMHNRQTPVYPEGFLPGVLADLQTSLEIAAQAGVPKEAIMLDPGVGFGKTYEMNLEVMRRIREIKVFGCPVLLAASRKSVIGLTLDLPVEERLEGTIATSVYGVIQGCAFVRVHDIAANKRAIQMTEAILCGR